MKRHTSDISPARRRSTSSSRSAGWRRPRNRLLRALGPVLVFSVMSIITQWSWFNSYNKEQSLLQQERLGLVNFVDDVDSSIWGVYSIHKQMEKFNMIPMVEHIAVVTSTTSDKTKAQLRELLGSGNVREIDHNFILDRVHGSLRGDEFLKMHVFSMPYDKLIVLDVDTLIRKSLLPWFDYPAPAATQAKGTIDWMTGALVVEPDKRLYMTLLEYLPLSRKWIPGQDNGKDTWNSGDSFHGFLSSFLLSKVTDDSMFTMDYGSFVQNRDMQERKENQYFWKYRPNSIETYNFGQARPWKNTTSFQRHAATCAMLIEWDESVADAPVYKLPSLPKFLSRCNREAVDASSLQKYA